MKETTVKNTRLAVYILPLSQLKKFSSAEKRNEGSETEKVELRIRKGKVEFFPLLKITVEKCEARSTLLHAVFLAEFVSG